MFEQAQCIIDTAIHFDAFLPLFIEEYGLFAYFFVFLIVFLETGLVIASRDAVAADAAGAELFGFNMQAVRHIFVANRMGLGDGRTSAMIFPRLSLADAMQAFTRLVYAQERVWA